MPRRPKYCLTLKEAKKYIDNTYSSQVYDSEEEFRARQTELIEILRKKGIREDTYEYTADEWNLWIYADNRYNKESQILFNKAAEKISKSFWKDEAWKNPKCHETCPYGSACDKEHIIIDDETYCYMHIWLGLIEFKTWERESKHSIMCDEVYCFACFYTCEVSNDKCLTDN